MSRDLLHPSPPRRGFAWKLPPAMTEFDRQRISNWIADAFAILCVRAGGGSAAERQVRLGFEAILRQLGTSPLRVVARSVPPAGRPIPASTADWRQIIHALERCRLTFSRYEVSLNPPERRTRELIEKTQGFAQQELAVRNGRSYSTAPSPSPRPRAKADPRAALVEVA